MANKFWKDMTVRIDNSTNAALVDITAYLTQASIRGSREILEDTAISDTSRSYLPGIVGATIPLSGLVNTTTDGIFGKLIGQFTSVTKTIEYKSYTGRMYNGEVFITNVEYSGGTNSIQTFSADATFDGSVNRTSVALA
jgi:hypothetical protein